MINNNTSISRRSFLRSTALLSASVIAAPALALHKDKKYAMGLQLYTIRDAMERDLIGTLKRVSVIGYKNLETYGFDPQTISFYGRKAKDFKNLLTDNQLITTSGHYDFHPLLNKPVDALKTYVDKCIEGAYAVGQKYITWPWLDPDSRTLEKFRIVADRLNVIGEQVKAAGLGFAYHNHDFEFTDHDGENGYDIILQRTDAALVKLQVDLYWVMHTSKRSPAELFALQPGRFVMWHVKDMHKVSRDYTELGNGSIDYKTILPLASASGMQYYFLEQGGNFAKDSMQSVTDSAVFFKKHLEKYWA